jgi:hypothetical protein
LTKTCFVIGPIGEINTPVREAADDFMNYIVRPCSALKEFGYGEPIRADMQPEPGRITSQVIKHLVEDDLVIADLTNNNANVYYELCLRHAVGKAVVHMATVGTPLSFDVQDNRTIFFSMHSRHAEQAREELGKHIRRVNQTGYKSMNPIVETVGIIRLEASTDPDKKVLGQLLAEMKSLHQGMMQLQEQLSVQRAQLISIGNTTNSGFGNSGTIGYPVSGVGGFGMGPLSGGYGIGHVAGFGSMDPPLVLRSTDGTPPPPKPKPDKE